MSSDTDDLSAFESTADVQQSRVNNYQEQFDKWIAAPFRILWSDYRGRFGIIITIMYIFMGTVGVVLVPFPEPNMAPQLVPAFQNTNYILGTDGLGQGLLSLMVHSTPAMMMMMFSGAIFGNVLGVSLGLISGYMGGTIDKIIMTITDTVSSIPGLPLLIILAAILQPRNPFVIGIVVNINGWAGSARGIRSQVLPLAEEEHVEAAKALGQSTSGILIKEILPHVLPLIFIGFLGGATSVINASVGLYFLGILPFTTMNWGVVLNYAYSSSSALYSLSAAHWIVVPLVTIVGLNLGLTLLAQAFDQVFNPRVQARHQRRTDESEPDEVSDEPNDHSFQGNQL